MQWIDTRKVVDMSSEEFVQDVAALLVGRKSQTVDAEAVLRGDLIQDEGWVKEVEAVTVVGARVVLHFESNPFSPCATYQLGHPALVHRRLPHDG
jgi:hypothetical protein